VKRQASWNFDWPSVQTSYNFVCMARPPRVPVMLPWECRVVYFFTICVIPRCNVLANDHAWLVLRQTLNRLDK